MSENNQTPPARSHSSGDNCEPDYESVAGILFPNDDDIELAIEPLIRLCASDSSGQKAREALGLVRIKKWDYFNINDTEDLLSGYLKKGQRISELEQAFKEYLGETEFLVNGGPNAMWLSHQLLIDAYKKARSVLAAQTKEGEGK